MSRLRPHTPDQRRALAHALQDLANELLAAHAQDVQRVLGDAIDHGYPSRATGTSRSPSNPKDENGKPVQPDSPAERSALNPDPAARLAFELLGRLKTLDREASAALSALRGWNPNRAVALCPLCGHPFKRCSTRCQQIIDGVRCGSSSRHDRRCRICDKVMSVGEPLRAGRCNACDIFKRRHGHDKNTASRLALDDHLLTEQGTYHDDGRTGQEAVTPL